MQSNERGDAPPGAEARREIECAVLLGDEGVEDVCEELDDRGALGVVGGEDESEFEDRVGVVPCAERAVSGPECRGPRAAVREHGPWWTKKTASQTMRLSGEGVTYMPNGQWPVWRREAYSRETAVRVRAGVASSEMLPVRALCFVFLLAGEERSMDGEGTRLDSIREAIDDARCSVRRPAQASCSAREQLDRRSVDACMCPPERPSAPSTGA